MKITQSQCAFNIIYSLAADHEINGETIASKRKRLATALALKIKLSELKFDAVVPIPNTGIIYAKHIANVLKVPFINPFQKKKTKRTLLLPVENRSVFYKRFLLKSQFKNHYKNVLIVDEALISGTTVSSVANWVKNKAARYSFAFTSLPMVNQCFLGNIKYSKRILDFGKNETNLINSLALLNKELGSDELFFLDHSSFFEIIDSERCCTLCFANF
jgi:glutamine phosphoribosylpyrophosphate amidotransferase